ncbi:MAG: hypothetical protein SOY30_01475 [Eubacteriales bacterium]|nr:hypothetical protein [Eubacteriales bacterium]
MPEEARLPLAIEARQRHHAAEAQLGWACADGFAAGIAGSARQRLEALVQGQYQIAVLQSEGGDHAVVQEQLVKVVAGLKTPRGRFGMHDVSSSRDHGGRSGRRGPIRYDAIVPHGARDGKKAHLAAIFLNFCYRNMK